MLNDQMAELARYRGVGCIVQRERERERERLVLALHRPGVMAGN